MAIFPFFSNKEQPVLVRCTSCYDEFYLSPEKVRLLETKNTADPVCPVKEACPRGNGEAKSPSFLFVCFVGNTLLPKAA